MPTFPTNKVRESTRSLCAGACISHALWVRGGQPRRSSTCLHVTRIVVEDAVQQGVSTNSSETGHMSWVGYGGEPSKIMFCISNTIPKRRIKPYLGVGTIVSPNQILLTCHCLRNPFRQGTGGSDPGLQTGQHLSPSGPTGTEPG